MGEVEWERCERDKHRFPPHLLLRVVTPTLGESEGERVVPLVLEGERGRGKERRDDPPLERRERRDDFAQWERSQPTLYLWRGRGRVGGV